MQDAPLFKTIRQMTPQQAQEALDKHIAAGKMHYGGGQASLYIAVTYALRAQLATAAFYSTPLQPA